jgi:hypothetical protein
MIRLIVEVRILILEYIKDAALDQHVACTNLHNLKWFRHIEVLCARNWIENVVACYSFKTARFYTAILLNSGSNISPVDRLLWIRCTNNVLVKSKKG